MRICRLALASLIVAVPAAAGTPTPAQDLLRSPGINAPIVGGGTATVGQFPTTVALDLGGGLCTGTLLTPDWVLTAAHCIDPDVLGQPTETITANLRVHFDTVNIFESEGFTVGATEIFKHPSFSVNALGNHDIGLIRLDTRVTDRTPVLVNQLRASAPVGIGLQLVGFGATSRTNPASAGVLRFVDQTSVSCSIVGLPDSSLLCWSQTNGRGKCEGDSGGPSFATIDGKLMQVGIASFADQQCQQLGADTRIDAELEFLLGHLTQCELDHNCDDGGGEDESGCCSTGSAGAPTAGLGVFAIALGLRRRRRQ